MAKQQPAHPSAMPQRAGGMPTGNAQPMPRMTAPPQAPNAVGLPSGPPMGAGSPSGGGMNVAPVAPVGGGMAPIPAVPPVSGGLRMGAPSRSARAAMGHVASVKRGMPSIPLGRGAGGGAGRGVGIVGQHGRRDTMRPTPMGFGSGAGAVRSAIPGV
jgi:hypothetical protein